MKLIRLLNRFFAWLLSFLGRPELVTAAESMAVQIADHKPVKIFTSYPPRFCYSGNAHDRRKARRAHARTGEA